MSNTKDFLLEIPGTIQSERLAAAPSYKGMDVSGRSFEDLVGRTAEFAKDVIFYSDDNTPDGDWTAFFKKIYDYDKAEVRTDVINQMKESSAVDPHLSLMFAFFELLLVEQEEINKIPQRQMDFYFQDILGFQKKTSQEGKATIYVQLAKKAESVSIPKGTKLIAGKDEDGKTRTYITDDEVRFGRESVAELATFDNKNGFKKIEGETMESDHAIYFASPYLNQPGILLNVDFGDNDKDSILKSMKMEYTTAKGWAPAKLIDRERDIKIFKSHITLHSLYWTIAAEDKPIAPYNPDIHGGNLDTKFPVIRFTQENGLDTIRAVNTSDFKELSISAFNANNITLENNAGPVENNAGINPFGINCQKGDTFTVKYPFPAVKNSTAPYYKFKDSSIKTDTSSVTDNGEEIGCKVTLKSDNCDQTKLASEYSKYVLSWMQDQNGTESSEKSSDGPSEDVLGNGLVAAIPTLAEKIYLPLAVYIDHNVSSYLVTPYVKAKINNMASATSLIDLENDKCSAVYIGLKDLQGTDNHISINLNVKNNLNAETVPAKVTWSYLSGDRWIKFNENEILKDSTRGLLKSGIVMFAVSGDIYKPHTIMDPNLQWIRAVADNSNALNVTSAKTQAIEVSFDEESAGESLKGESLKSGSITKLEKSITGVKAVSQPESGEAGTLAEGIQEFFCRASEQTRHKGRAWSIWDYEHLVLEKFQNVSYVKCLSCCDKDGEHSPGEVTLVIVPKNEAEELKPSIGGVLKDDILNEIKKVSSPFISINVINPDYQEIQIDATVHLRKGFLDKEKCKSEIQQRLTEYFATHIDRDCECQHFKNGDSKTDILVFLENIPCVDYIDSMDVYVENKAIVEESITLSKPHQVFTSSDLHKITCLLSEN